MKMMGMKCGHCGSTNVTHDALVRWSNAAQEWQNSSTLDNSDCDACGNHNCVVEYELRGRELADAMHARRLAGVQEFIARLREQLDECGAIGHLVMPELVEQMNAIRSKLSQFAATMAQQDELIDALALTLPYAETRAEDMALEPKCNRPEDQDAPGADEAESVVAYAERVLTQHGGAAYLLERGQRAGVRS